MNIPVTIDEALMIWCGLTLYKARMKERERGARGRAKGLFSKEAIRYKNLAARIDKLVEEAEREIT